MTRPIVAAARSVASKGESMNTPPKSNSTASKRRSPSRTVIGIGHGSAPVSSSSTNCASSSWGTPNSFGLGHLRRPGLGAHDDGGRLLRHAAGALPPPLLDRGFDLVAVEALERAGDDDRHPGQGLLLGRARWPREVQPGGAQPLDQLPVRLGGEELVHRPGDDRADTFGRRQLVGGRRHEVVEVAEGRGQHFRHGRAHVDDVEPEQQVAERPRPSTPRSRGAGCRWSAAGSPAGRPRRRSRASRCR